MVMFMLMMMQFFSVFYQDLLPEHFGTTLYSLRVSFDSYLAAFSFGVFDGITDPMKIGYLGNADKYFFYLLLIAVLFVTNILLFNFMVAILSEKYEEATALGKFNFKCSLFNYSERFLLAFQDPSC